MKKVILLVLIISLSIGMIGCSNKPEGEPQAIIEEYYSLINSSDYESAYELLSSKLKKDTDLEKFIKWNELLSDIYENNEYKPELKDELEDEELDGNEFSYINKFKVNKSWKSLYSEKQETDNNEEYVVSEDEEWKIYRLKEDFNLDEKIASTYSTLGWMYAEGKGEKEDKNKAIEMFSNAINYNDSEYYYHYSLSGTLNEMNRFDEAITSLNKSIELIEEDKDHEEYKGKLSDANNLLGVIYLNKGDIKKAKEYYTLALELDPDNQYAKSNLANLD